MSWGRRISGGEVWSRTMDAPRVETKGWEEGEEVVTMVWVGERYWVEREPKLEEPP